MERKGLTAGDGIAVAVLLLFILGWLAGWSFLLWWYEEEGNDVSDLGTWDSAFLLLLAWMPSMWAANLVKHIVKGPWVTR